MSIGSSEFDTHCNACAGALVEIRGRYPRDIKRLVCPTCLADKMDDIRKIADKDYGIACQSIASLKL